MTVIVGMPDQSGVPFVLDSLPQTLTRNVDGTVNTVSATNGVNTWTQTFTYTAGAVTAISAWVKT